MGLILKAAAFLTGRRWAAWNALTRQPDEVQNRLLLQIIEHNRSGRFGRDHRFDTIRSLSDYRNHVEIGDYERLRPYVERAKNGEANALTSEPVLMFTQTSGSTGQPKLIPITESTRNSFRRLTRFWYYRGYVAIRDVLAASCSVSLVPQLREKLRVVSLMAPPPGSFTRAVHVGYKNCLWSRTKLRKSRTPQPSITSSCGWRSNTRSRFSLHPIPARS